VSETFRDMILIAKDALSKAGIKGAGNEAPLIAALAAGIDRDRIMISMADRVEREHLQRLDQLLLERGVRKPLSHILGYRDFFKHRFHVGPQVLDPRPETEILVMAALAEDFTRVLDLGTGSGAILISLLAERPQAFGVGTDLSETALSIARQNVQRLGVADRCELCPADWFAGVEGEFDLIVSNPPYIAADEMAGLAPELSFEPRMALTDEADGLTAYRAITMGAGDHLKPGGRLMVEIGPTQAKAVTRLYRESGLTEVSVLRDLDGRDRVVIGKLARSNG